MNAKEKAISLYNRFNGLIPIEAHINEHVENINQKLITDHNATKNCAILAVDEILHLGGLTSGQLNFWQCVHEELNAL